MKKVCMILAGIILIPAFSFSSESGWLNLRDRLTTPVLTRISNASWIEQRFYPDLPEERRFPEMLEDFAFETWLAQKAKADGFQLSPEEKEAIFAREKEIEYGLALDLMSKKADVSEEEITLHSRKWTSPLPERWEVFYIFIDDTMTRTEEERREPEKRAIWLKEQLTPENFREMARLWSDSPDSADGGVLGAIVPDRMGLTFSSQIKKTPVGTIGGPYRTTSGWNIFYVRSHTPTKERSFSREKLREMTARIKADEALKKAFNSNEEWKFLMRDLGALYHPDTKPESTVMENHLLSNSYIRSRARERKPTEDDLREIYRDRSAVFIRPPSRKAREILLSSRSWSMGETREAWIARRDVRNTARALRERILKGEDFAKLAKKHSISKTASSGGELDWIQEPSSYLYDMALGALKIGEISPPIATEKGYLLLQLLEERRDQPIPYEEARERCENIFHLLAEKNLKDNLREKFSKQ